MTTRTSLTKFAPVMQDPQPMSEAERRQYLRRAWLDHGLPAFQRGDVNELLWDLLKREATRLYGERERRS